MVILKDKDFVCSHWWLARVIETISDKDDLIRKVKILVGDPTLTKQDKRTSEATVLVRPIQKLTLLLGNLQNEVSRKKSLNL